MRLIIFSWFSTRNHTTSFVVKLIWWSQDRNPLLLPTISSSSTCLHQRERERESNSTLHCQWNWRGPLFHSWCESTNSSEERERPICQFYAPFSGSLHFTLPTLPLLSRPILSVPMYLCQLWNESLSLGLRSRALRESVALGNGTGWVVVPGWRWPTPLSLWKQMADNNSELSWPFTFSFMWTLILPAIFSRLSRQHRHHTCINTSVTNSASMCGCSMLGRTRH